MKKIKIFCAMLCLLFVIGFSGTAGGTKTEAAAVTNVMKAPKAKAGQWVIGQMGYRYRYTSNGQYAKNAWLNISGHIYYFKANGYLQTGWKSYNKKRYYFNGDGTLVTGWKKIAGKKYYFAKGTGAAVTGKRKFSSKYYYFSSTGVMQTGWHKIGNYYYYFKTNGSMAVNTKIGKYYVDKDGKRKTAVSDATNKPDTAGNNSSSTDTAKKSDKVDIFVGDSRTVGMCSAVHGSNCKKCIAKGGMGYDWFVTTGEAQLKKMLKKNPKAVVVFNFGINDLANYDKYIARYKKLMKSYPKATFYFVSVNPVDSKYDWGWMTCKEMQNWIAKFNKAIKKAFPKQYIDCHSYLTKNKFETRDGIHYTSATYKKIYNYILKKVS